MGLLHLSLWVLKLYIKNFRPENCRAASLRLPECRYCRSKETRSPSDPAIIKGAENYSGIWVKGVLLRLSEVSEAHPEL